MSKLTKSIRAVFGSNTDRLTYHRASSFRELGYVKPDGDSVPDEYLIRISSRRHNATVVAPIQENITLRVESFWGPATPKSLIQALDQLVQASSGGRASLVTKAASRRMWYGSTPIRMQVRLVFQAIKDPFREVVEPMRVLQCLALPAMALQEEESKDWWSGVKQTFPILAPPGPTPFTPEGLLREASAAGRTLDEIGQKFGAGDEIMVEIGRFLTFSSVVVTSSTSTTPATFGPDGNPVRSEVSVTFETYEMMTVEDLNKVYNKTSVSTANGDQE